MVVFFPFDFTMLYHFAYRVADVLDPHAARFSLSTSASRPVP